MIRVVLAAVLALVLCHLTPSAVAAQEFEGRVVEAGDETPIAGAVVELLSVHRVTVTDTDGRFAFDAIGSAADSVRVSRFGYASRVVWVEFGAAGESVLALDRDPVELEGVTTALDFGERLSILEDRLDERVGEWPGYARVAGPGDLRSFDAEWEGDPWKFLHYGPLRVTWEWNADPTRFEDQVFVTGYGTVKPEVWIDDRQVWLQVLVETPNESLCRVETYMPKVRPWFLGPRDPEPPPQIRAYTCSFMARVATGEVEVCPVLQWGRLISGPEAGGPLPEVSRRAAVRPPGSVTPIDLGPDLDLSTTATGVGSGACL